MKQIDRLVEYFKTKGLKTHFSIERKVGFGSGYINKQKQREGEISQKSLELVVKSCPDLNIKWLLTGDGEMLHSKEWNMHYASVVTEPGTNYGTNWKELYITTLQEYVLLQNKYTQLLEELNSKKRAKAS